MQTRRRRDRGFSLLVVFMLMIVMVGVAATVVLSSQQDLSVAGQERESTQAFYAAEYAIAQAKDYLEKAVPQQIPNISNFAAAGGWSAILQALNTAGVAQGCAAWSPTLPSTAVAPRMSWQDYTTAPFYVGDPTKHVMWRYCIHNNGNDLAYLDTAGNSTATPTGCGGASGDNCDWRDSLHYVTIEAWGAFPVDTTTLLPLPGAAVSHLSVNLGPPTTRTQLPLSSGYSQEGGSGAHDNNGGAIDTTAINTAVIR